MEIILNTSYEKLCDHKWNADSIEPPPNNSVVHCHLDNIVPFFNTVEKTNNRYILIVSNSDYGLGYQRENMPCDKMKRWLKFIDTKDLGYNSMVIPSRCDIEQCRITDKYSVFMYSWVKYTLDKIPANIVKMFCTNLDIDDDRCVGIPFGIAEWSEPLIKNRDKDKTLYVNFMLNTVERAALMSSYKSHIHNDLVCERDVPHERFIDCVARSKFVLSPNGNGMCSYRILESLYCRSIPIIQKSRWAKNTYSNLPVLALDSLYVDIDELNDIHGNLYSQVDWSLENSDADLGTWRKRIEESRNLL